MQVELVRLPSLLEKSLSPVYFISGDEPLQQGEAVALIRKKARAEGYLNREVLHVEGQFDWNQLPALCLTQSLFADKNLIELNLPTAKPGKQGGAIIESVVAQCSTDNVLVIISGKLDSYAKRAKWFKAITDHGVVLQVWPIEGNKLANWLRQRLQQKGMQVDELGLKLLLQRIEGNLLAAAQEIEKLYILYGPVKLTETQILSSVADNSRYDIFKLMDSILLGHSAKVIVILKSLMAEKLAVPVVLWAITRELRLLASLSFASSKKGRFDAVFQQYNIWDSKKNLYVQALSRAKLSDWQSLLKMCAIAEKQTKGVEVGNEWDLIEQICLGISRGYVVEALNQ